MGGGEKMYICDKAYLEENMLLKFFPTGTKTADGITDFWNKTIYCIMCVNPNVQHISGQVLSHTLW